MRKALIIFLLLLSLVSNLVFPKSLMAETLVGTAKNKGKTIYLENHQVFYEATNPKIIKKIETKYTNDSKDIGFRQQEFVLGHYMPNLVFKDNVSSDTYSITVTDKIAVLKSYYNKIEKTTEFKITKNLVTTASISKFIFENFDDLLNSAMTVKCLMPKSHRLVSLNIKKYNETADQVTFTIRPSSLLLKYLSKKTYVTFGKKTKYWVKYQGFSNLKSKKGKVLEVKIDYMVSQSKL